MDYQIHFLSVIKLINVLVFSALSNMSDPIKLENGSVVILPDYSGIFMIYLHFFFAVLLVKKCNSFKSNN